MFSGPPSSPEPLAKVPGLRVLFADDSETNRQIAVFVFQQLGCTVDVVQNGREAVEAASRSEYDLVFMDCDMPVLNGYEAAREIRAGSGRAAGPRIIALTACADVGVREKCAAAGMDDYMTKPYDMRQLAAILRDSRPSSLSLPEAQDQGPPVSAEAITAIRQQLGAGAGQMFGHLVSVFQREGQECLQNMEATAAGHDLEKLARHSHRLRGVGSSFGARKLDKLCTAFESQLRTGNCPNITGHIHGIHDEFSRVIAALKELG